MKEKEGPGVTGGKGRMKRGTGSVKEGEVGKEGTEDQGHKVPI